ncbi:hypothetical protein QP296_27810, partial [Escherichia coli]|nr:hypothetical protein [Escherichia coli]
VKQAGKLSDAERAQLARACKTAADELDGGTPGADETAEKQSNLDRARAAKALVMLMEGATNA